MDRADIFTLAPDWGRMSRAHHRSGPEVLRLLLRAKSQQGVTKDASYPFFATGSKLQHQELMRFTTRPNDSLVEQMPPLERLCRRALYHPDVDHVAGARAGGGRAPMCDNTMRELLPLLGHYELVPAAICKNLAIVLTNSTPGYQAVAVLSAG